MYTCVGRRLVVSGAQVLPVDELLVPRVVGSGAKQGGVLELMELSSLFMPELEHSAMLLLEGLQAVEARRGDPCQQPPVSRKHAHPEPLLTASGPGELRQRDYPARQLCRCGFGGCPGGASDVRPRAAPQQREPPVRSSGMRVDLEGRLRCVAASLSLF